MAKAKVEHPRIIDPVAAQICAELKAAKEVRANAKDLEDSLKEKLENHMTKYQQEMETDHFIVAGTDFPADPPKPEWDLNMVPGTNVSLSSDKLLEKGVDPAIIAYATKRTNYTQVRLDFVKQKVTK